MTLHSFSTQDTSILYIVERSLAWILELVSCKWEVNFNNQSTKSLVVRTLTNRNPEEEGEEAGSIE